MEFQATNLRLFTPCDKHAFKTKANELGCLHQNHLGQPPHPHM